MRLLTLLPIVLSSSLMLAAEPPGNPPLRWWKGNLHTHSLWSDGDDFPEMIVDWYRDARLPLPRPLATTTFSAKARSG